MFLQKGFAKTGSQKYLCQKIVDDYNNEMNKVVTAVGVKKCQLILSGVKATTLMLAYHGWMYF
jgi:hypothetical protein